ncbi:uncharacterized protein LOC105258697 [Camponotus floridanus]|uniref:uncharacterized protein LOC105258697 n=1 Tax=Camponotus floridanus TaxID=104421 RepID=UPI000DC6A3A8|nr:uncharacterized protein LOC105258697 [Camponotus floridanus]
MSLIQQRLPKAQWRHFPGQENPADCASRGIAPRDLLNHPLWWNGPAWLLKGQSLWPDSNDQTIENVPETRTTVLVAISKDRPEPEILLQFSTLHRLLHVSAWCLRWRRTSRNSLSTVLLPDELDSALLRWLRIVQGVHYSAEFAAVRESRPMPHGSHLSRLHPFIDDKGVLRVGGRLKHAILIFDERHPMIAPPTSWLTKLMVESCHRRTLHGGTQLTLGLLHLRFWVPQGRAVVKRILHRCVTCTRWRANTPQPLMGDLPRERVTPARPFLRTGVDYAGPIFIRTSKGRRAHKAFIVVFVCLCSRAIHLEVVSDYSSDAFLAALRRFVSRRGLCEEMYSDCGTNFIGADRQLRELFRASSSDGRRISQAVTKEGISWRFNPPSAPHFGGLWEAAVKSTKHHLRRVIGEATLTFEEMSTLLAQIEACLNSRPLQALSDDPDDLSALTPGHLLIGAPLLAVPEPSSAERSPSTLSRWQLLQRMRDHFWQRWSQEYIHALAPRPKWLKAELAPEIGALCLVRLESTPPIRCLSRVSSGYTQKATARSAL